MVDGQKTKSFRLDEELLEDLIATLLDDLQQEQNRLKSIADLTTEGEMTTANSFEQALCIYSDVSPKLEFIVAVLDTGVLPPLTDEGMELIDFWLELFQSVKGYLEDDN